MVLGQCSARRMLCGQFATTPGRTRNPFHDVNAPHVVATLGLVRIVSLLPGATETLFALGLGDQVVGVTHECDHPGTGLPVAVTASSLALEGLDGGEIDRRVAAAVESGAELYRVDG